MLTAQEYIKKYRGKPWQEIPDTIWTDANSFMERILKFDHTSAIFPSTNDVSSWVPALLSDALTLYGKKQAEDFVQSFDNSFVKVKKVKPVLDLEGDLQVDEYLNGSRTPFENHVKVEVEKKQATSIFINMWVGSFDTKDNDVEHAHDECYKIAARAEADNWPCRVVGYMPCVISEYNNCKRPITLFVVFKNYNDPIFPAIWAGIQNNKVANALCVARTRYFFGSCDPQGGRNPARINAKLRTMENYCDADEEVITFGKYIRAYESDNFIM